MYLLDNNGYPIVAKNDIEIQLSSSNSFDHSDTVTIPQGKTHVIFQVDVSSDGNLLASADNLASADISFSKHMDDISVQLTIAPDIVAENSKLFFSIILLKDGRPFIPPYTVDAYITSSSSEVVRTTLAIPQTTTGLEKYIIIREGSATGELFTGKQGKAIITVSVENTGTVATFPIIVGPAKVTSYNLDGANDISAMSLGVVQSSRNDKPLANFVKIWSLPNIIQNQGLGVIALYNLQNDEFSAFTQTTTLESQTNNTKSLNRIITDVTLIPITADGRNVLLSSNGLIHDAVIPILDSNLVSHGQLFEVQSKHFEQYDISVNGHGLIGSTSDILSTLADSSFHNLIITPLPIPTSSSENQLLAFVSLVRNGTVVSPQKTFSNLNLHASSIGSNSENLSLHSGDNVFLLYGNVHDSGQISISANMGDVESDTSEIYPSGIPSKIDFWMPSQTYMSQPFPFIIHELDQNNNIIKKTNSPLSISATPGFDVDFENGSYDI